MDEGHEIRRYDAGVRPRSIQGDDARYPRVHPPLPHPRAASGFNRIRHYGLFASSKRIENIATSRTQTRGWSCLAALVLDAIVKHSAARQSLLVGRDGPSEVTVFVTGEQADLLQRGQLRLGLSQFADRKMGFAGRYGDTLLISSSDRALAIAPR
jgi:hypothetical protein